MVTEPLETKNFFVAPSSSYTVTTPGLRTAREATWEGKMPKDPEKEGQKSTKSVREMNG